MENGKRKYSTSDACNEEDKIPHSYTDKLCLKEWRNSPWLKKPTPKQNMSIKCKAEIRPNI